MKRLFGTIGLTYLTVLAAAFYFYGVWTLVILSAAALTAVMTGILLKKAKHRYAWTIIISGASAVAAVISIFLFTNIIYQPTVDYYSDKEISFEGYICDEIRISEKSLYVPIRTEKIDGEDKQLNIDLTVYSDIEASEFDRVRGRLTLHRETLKNDISRGRWFNAEQDKSFEIARTGETHFTPYRYAVYCRSQIKKMFDDLLPRRSASLCKAIMLGDKPSLTKQARHDITRTGTSYLIVVSGMHLSIICGFFIMILRKLRVKRIAMFIAVCVLVLGFSVLTGFPPSVIRAGIMTVITFGSTVLRRKSDSVNSLGAAALVLTALNPFAAGDIGLIMSFTATLGIVLWAEPIDNQLIRLFHINRIKRRRIRNIPAFFTNLCAVSVSASLWIIPVNTLFFQRVSPLIAAISLLTVPIVTVLLLLMLIASALYFIPFVGLLCKPLAWLMDLLCDLFFRIISFFATLPYSSVNVHHLYFYIWLGLTVALVIAGYIIHAKKSQVLLFTLISVSVLGADWSLHTLLAPSETEIMIDRTYRGLTVAVCREDSLDLLACGGNGGFNGDLLDRLYACGDSVDTLILPNHVNYSSYFPMIDESFCISSVYVNEKYRDDIGVAEAEDIRNNTSFSIRLSDSSLLEIINIDNVVYQYLSSEESTLLFLPHNADVKKLPEKYRTADTIIMDYVSDNAELLSCVELIYTGHQNKRWENNYDSLSEICDRITTVENESYVIKFN